MFTWLKSLFENPSDQLKAYRSGMSALKTFEEKSSKCYAGGDPVGVNVRALVAARAELLLVLQLIDKNLSLLRHDQDARVVVAACVACIETSILKPRLLVDVIRLKLWSILTPSERERIDTAETKSTYRLV